MAGDLKIFLELLRLKLWLEQTFAITDPILSSEWQYAGKIHIFWEGPKILRNLPLTNLTTVHTVKSKGKISQNFVAFSEHMNFKRKSGSTVNIHWVVSQMKFNMGSIFHQSLKFEWNLQIYQLLKKYIYWSTKKAVGF